MNLNRRDFLKTVALGAAAFSLDARTWSRAVGANDDIRVAVIGFRGQGAGHIKALNRLSGVRVVAICDVDRQVLEAKARELGSSVQACTDLRRVLDNKDVDAVSIATPNHWHALATVWACQAGKDVYVEKPVSHNVFEGRKCVEAARKYNRIVQAGTQSRSNEALRQAIIWLREGHLGKIRIARGLCYKRRESIGKAEGPQSIPPEIDYDLWCGPAEKLPLARKRLHYDWHWVWNTGNGDLGNQGVHQMDIARWALGKMELSPMVFSVGGRLGYSDDGETPNTQMVVHNYGDALLIFEVRGLPAKAPEPQAGEEGKAPPMDKYRGLSVGHVIECEGGYLAGTTAFDNDHQPVKRFSGKSDDEGGHFGNFIKAVRSRKREDLNLKTAVEGEAPPMRRRKITGGAVKRGWERQTATDFSRWGRGSGPPGAARAAKSAPKSVPTAGPKSTAPQCSAGRSGTGSRLSGAAAPAPPRRGCWSAAG